MKSAGKIILRPMGEYNPSTTYRYLDLVTYNNCLYIVRVDSVIGVSPDSGDTSKWIFLLNGSLLTTKSGTVISHNAGYAEVGEWVDGNPSDEDRIGYFVAIDEETSGTTMIKAKSTSNVRGVTVTAPAFSGNCSADKFDSEGNLLKQYAYVVVMGLVSVIDNGTCTVNSRCMPADDGTAIPSTNNMGYQVISRIDNTHVLIEVEPSADMLNRIKTQMAEMQEEIKGGVIAGVKQNGVELPISEDRKVDIKVPTLDEEDSGEVVVDDATMQGYVDEYFNNHPTLPTAVNQINKDVEDLNFRIECLEGNIQLETFEQIQDVVKRGLAEKYFTAGDQINVPWSDGSTEYVVPMNIAHFGEFTLSDGKVVPGMLVQWHYCTPFGIQFDQNEALYYANEAIPAATYHFTCGNSWGSNIVSRKSYQFTLASEVPKGGQIQIGLENSEIGACPDQNPANWRIRTYSSQLSTEPIDIVTLSEGKEGTDLGTWSSSTKFASSGLNNMQRSSYGYNRWSQSAVRQYLNSHDAIGAWWKPQNVFDRPPIELASQRGFLAGFNDDFLSIIKPVKVTTALNTISDSEIGTTEDTYDTFFLPSKRNMNLNEQLENVEGEIWEYWLRATNGVKPNDYENYAAPITYAINAKTSPQYVRLRSDSRGSANNTWIVYSNGYVNSGNRAADSNRFSPACVIC